MGSAAMAGVVTPYAGTSPAAAPLAGSVARLDALLGVVHLRTGPPTGDPRWVNAGDLLADPARLDRVIAGAQRRVADQDPSAPREVGVSYATGWYAGGLAAAAAGLYELARRVPDVAPGAIALRFHPGGWVEGVALLSTRFACLPGDPAAGHPDATVVHDETELAAVLRARLADHLTGFFAAVGTRSRRGRHARWGLATDAIAAAVWAVRAAADRERGEATELAAAEAAEALLPGGTPPYAAAGTRLLVDSAGNQHPTRCRAACCLAYMVTEMPACVTCPRLDDVERLARLTADAPGA